MPRSRVRDGRKAHNKRVKERKDKIKAEFEKAQKEAWKKFEEHKLSASKDTAEDFQYPELK